MIAGLESITEGTVKIDDKVVNDLGPASVTSPWSSRTMRSIRI